MPKISMQPPTPLRSRLRSKLSGLRILPKLAVLVVLVPANALETEETRSSIVSPDEKAAGSHLFTRPKDGARMILIPAQHIENGSADLPAFLVDEKEICQQQYLHFAREEEKSLPGLPRIKQGDAHPVVGVPWMDAVAYCSWVGARLPTEVEWQQAAGYFLDGRIYPWGNDWQDGHANSASAEDGFICTAPVGSFPAGASPFGVLDLVGNAAEWVQGEAGPGLRIARGGSWRSPGPGDMELSRRTLLEAKDAGQWVGFRCAADASE